MTYLQGIDVKLILFIHDNFHFPILDQIMIFASYIGNNGAIWVIITLLLMSIKKYRHIGIMIFCSLLLCIIIGNITLKPLIARIRPFNVFPQVILLISSPTDFSFPSGHTMTSFASATVLYLTNKKWGVAALILATLIAFSRVYLFVHYPSDIVGGVIIGVLIALLSVKFITSLYNKTK
ncbi:phosphatase PAP2 family protein [Alkalibaculum sp. M08DMB]|uniref:Phosphatase PAP2 family protein n=1 Tax=Alkalibaculum sporogenes TaxID=2655001 RepID=A0A6A7K8L8_9FIRM|nr:phosphatase PAP2 family protein [Alkalibaculum sporogenes]MPW25764.1 phosphatase PAP2 family protein [Alkalibaculum sporogenes]